MTSSVNDDLSFFEQMQDVKPLANINQTASTRPKSKQDSLAKQLKRQALEKQIALDDNGLSVDYVVPLDPMDYITYKQDGVQEGVYKNLRLGKYHIDTRLSLKHLKFDEARLSLYNTIVDCHQRGIRTLLIDHGIGLQSKPFPGFMKSYVNQWLTEINFVIAFHTALKQHGGLSCTYVLLQKHPNQKQINREVHQRRG